MEVKVVILLLVLFCGFVSLQKTNKSPKDKSVKPMAASDEDLGSVKLKLKETLKLNKRLRKENQKLKQNSSSKKKDNPASDKDIEIATLKALLKETRKANNRLRKQNRRQQQVWFALEQMCKALGQTPAKKEKDMNPSTNTTDVEPTKSHKEVVAAYSIKPVSISSKVLDPSGRANISVAFTSERKPAVEWLYWTRSANMYKTAGWTNYMDENKTYISGVTIAPELLTSYLLYFRVYDTKEFFGISVNLSAVLSSGYQTISSPQLHFGLPKFDRNASTGNFKATIAIKRNVTVTDDIECYLTGLNMSTNPPEMFEITSLMHMNVTLKNVSGSEYQAEIDIDRKHTQDGGLLSLLFKIHPEVPGFYSHLHFGKQFSIISAKTQTVIAPNVTGLYQLPARTVLYPPYQTIMCAAMGNPRPDTVLEKHNQNGRKTEGLKEELNLVMDEFTTETAYTIKANDPDVEGKYTCRAWNRYSAVTVTTEVVLFQEAKVDKDATGLKMNSSNKLEISCQASGMPMPELQLSLYDEQGPDIARSSRYKVVRSNVTDSTTLLEVTIAPVDTDIYKVYCRAINCNYCEYDSVPIQIFPEPAWVNWNLYDEMGINKTISIV